MKNENEIIAKLSESKEFAEYRQNETTPTIYKEIIDCLDEAKGAAREDDVDALKDVLNRIDAYKVSGWALTRDVWELI